MAPPKIHPKVWETHRDLIISLYQNGSKRKEIIEELEKRGLEVT